MSMIDQLVNDIVDNIQMLKLIDKIDVQTTSEDELREMIAKLENKRKEQQCYQYLAEIRKIMKIGSKVSPKDIVVGSRYLDFYFSEYEEEGASLIYIAKVQAIESNCIRVTFVSNNLLDGISVYRSEEGDDIIYTDRGQDIFYLIEE